MVKKLGISLLFIFIFLSLVSASSQWSSFGNGINASIINAVNNTQLGSLSYATHYNLTRNDGYLADTHVIANNHFAYEPLVFAPNENVLCNQSLNNASTNKNYLVYPVSSSLKLIDDSLATVNSIGTVSNTIANIGAYDFNNDCKLNDIVGLYNTSTDIQFKDYHIDDSLSFSLLDTLTTPLPFDVGSISGLTCDVNTNDCFFGVQSLNYTSNYYKVNSTGIFNFYNYTFDNFNQNDYPLTIQDIDNDGDRDFATISVFQLIVFDENGNSVFNKSTSLPFLVKDVKFIKPSSSPLWNVVWFIDSQGVGSSSVISFNSTGSSQWSIVVGTTDAFIIGSSINKYTDDNFDDVFLAVGDSSGAIEDINFYVLKGTDGSTLNSATLSNHKVAQAWEYGLLQLATGNFDNDTTLDFMLGGTTNKFGSTKSEVLLYSLDNGLLFNDTIDASYKGCVIADLDNDDYNDVICSGVGTNIPSITKAWFSLQGNSNPTINTIFVSPSTSITIGQTLTINISATDSNNDTIIYAHQCFNGDSIIEEDDSIFTCSYGLAGSYTLTALVRDSLHSGYDSFSQVITVGASSTTILDINQDLVNTDDINQGFLPDIYHGILRFFSIALIPFLWGVFILIAILMLLAIFGGLKNKLSRL